MSLYVGFLDKAKAVSETTYIDWGIVMNLLCDIGTCFVTVLICFLFVFAVWGTYQYFGWILPRKDCDHYWNYRCHLQGFQSDLQETRGGRFHKVIYLL